MFFFSRFRARKFLEIISFPASTNGKFIPERYEKSAGPSLPKNIEAVKYKMPENSMCFISKKKLWQLSRQQCSSFTDVLR
jgi:hypothetical protein